MAETLKTLPRLEEYNASGVFLLVLYKIKIFIYILSFKLQAYKKMSDPSLVFIHNRIVPEKDAKISINNKGLMLGDGIFETLLIKEKNVCYFEEHWQRFILSAQKVFLKVPISKQQLLRNMQILISKTTNKNSVLRWTLMRGVGERGLDIRTAASPLFFMQIMPYRPKRIKHFSLVLSPYKRNEYSALANIKTVSYQEQVLAYQYAKNHHAHDVLICNTKNEMVCTSRGNLFFINKKNELFTPPLSAGVLPGIMRAKILEKAERLKIKTYEVSLQLKDLKNIQEIFMTNSLVGIQPVNRVINYWIKE